MGFDKLGTAAPRLKCTRRGINMDKAVLISSVAYCGLVCRLCHLANECDGCKETANKCSAHAEREKGCFHRDCCIRQGLKGCWECPEFPCQEQMFAGPTRGELIGFCRFIREEGLESFIDALLANEQKGLPYGKLSYGDKTEAEVVAMLQAGLSELHGRR